jgi:enoyl-CoA hydratase/carnithine racemase
VVGIGAQEELGNYTQRDHEESTMSESNAPAVTIDVDGAVGTLRFNRPERLNAWGSDISKGLLDGLQAMEQDTNVKVVLLTGEGRAFSAGANLRDPLTHSTPSVEEYLRDISVQSGSSVANVFESVLGFTKPLVAVVNGYSVGIGFLTTLCCDVIIAGESAEFWLPQASIGILPAYAGTARLAQWIGKGRAMEIALTGRRVTAHEARDIGLVSQVVADADLATTARAFADSLAEKPALGVKLTKESLNFALEVGSLRQAGVSDLYRFMALTLTDDASNAHEEWRSRLGGGIEGSVGMP